MIWEIDKNLCQPLWKKLTIVLTIEKTKDKINDEYIIQGEERDGKILQ